MAGWELPALSISNSAARPVLVLCPLTAVPEPQLRAWTASPWRAVKCPAGPVLSLCALRGEWLARSQRCIRPIPIGSNLNLQPAGLAVKCGGAERQGVVEYYIEEAVANHDVVGNVNGADRIPKSGGSIEPKAEVEDAICRRSALGELALVGELGRERIRERGPSHYQPGQSSDDETHLTH
jgi:hypothetical protein